MNKQNLFIYLLMDINKYKNKINKSKNNKIISKMYNRATH